MAGFIISHGSGGGGASRALSAYQQTRDIEAEAQRREGEYQAQRKIAEVQTQIAQKQLGGMDAASTRADRSLAVDEGQLQLRQRNQDLSEQQFAQQAREAEQQMEVRKRQLAALDQDVSEQEALGVFQSLQAQGIEPQTIKDGLNGAAQVLGGGIGSALKLVSTMAPGDQEIFRRLPPEFRSRYLLEKASEARQYRAQAAIRQGVESLSMLESIGVVTPDVAMKMRQDLGEAKTEEERTAVLAQIYEQKRGAQKKLYDDDVRKGVLSEVERQIVLTAQLPDPDQAEVIRKSLYQFKAEVMLDANPDPQQYKARMRQIYGGSAGDSLGSAMSFNDAQRAAQMQAPPPTPTTPDVSPDVAQAYDDAVAKRLTENGFTAPPAEGTPEHGEWTRIIEETTAEVDKKLGRARRNVEEGDSALTASRAFGVPQSDLAPIESQRVEKERATSRANEQWDAANGVISGLPKGTSDAAAISALVSKGVSANREEAANVLKLVRRGISGRSTKKALDALDAGFGVNEAVQRSGLSRSQVITLREWSKIKPPADDPQREPIQ